MATDGSFISLSELPNSAFDLPDASAEEGQGAGFLFKRTPRRVPSYKAMIVCASSHPVLCCACPHTACRQPNPLDDMVLLGVAGSTDMIMRSLPPEASRGGRGGAADPSGHVSSLGSSERPTRMTSTGMISLRTGTSSDSLAHALRVAWLCLRLFSLGLMFLVLPMRIALSPRWLSLGWLALDLVVDLVSITHLASELTPGCSAAILASSDLRDLSQLSTASRSSALKRFIRTLLLMVDVCACIPFEVALYARSPLPDGLPAAMLPRLLFLRRGGKWLGELSELLHEWASDYYAERTTQVALSASHGLRKMLFLCSFMLIICHWTACGWLMLPVRQGKPFEDSWLAQDGVLIHDGVVGSWGNWWPEYVRSLYWVIVAVSTIGFGDIVPATLPETVFATVVVLIGALFYPAVVGAVATLLVESLTASARKAAPARDFVRRAKLPPHLARQIISFNALGQSVREETRLLRSLPPSLHLQLSAVLHQQMVNSVPIFAGCPTPFLVSARRSPHDLIHSLQAPARPHASSHSDLPPHTRALSSRFRAAL